MGNCRIRNTYGGIPFGLDISRNMWFYKYITMLRRRCMLEAEDKKTRERLLECARAEFAAKGYMKASLRKICAAAGVTTGALYFFFKDKEDLFAAIVEPPLLGLKQMLYEHFNSEDELNPETYVHLDGDHDEFAAGVIRRLYANRDEFLLLLTKAQGTRFENVVDELVESTEKRYYLVAEKLAAVLPEKCINRYMLHWLSHIAVEAFCHLLTHEENVEKAIAVTSRFMDFIVGGWMKLTLEDKEPPEDRKQPKTRQEQKEKK